MTGTGWATKPSQPLPVIYRYVSPDMTRVRTFTEEQKAQRAARSRAWYADHREQVLERLRNRTPEERAADNERERQRWATNPTLKEKNRVYSRTWRENHPEMVAASNLRYSRSPKGRATKRADILMRYFHLTVEQYDAMYAEQEGLCAICRQPETKQHRGFGVVQTLSVDHDHRCCPGKTSCGKCVRGLLCDRCNLCRFPDDPALLRAAADYFESYRSI